MTVAPSHTTMKNFHPRCRPLPQPLSSLYREPPESRGRFKRSKFCFQISKIPKLRKSQRGILPNYFKNFGSYWGLRNLEPLTFKGFSPFQICVAPAHKGDIRARLSLCFFVFVFCKGIVPHFFVVLSPLLGTESQKCVAACSTGPWRSGPVQKVKSALQHVVLAT